MGWSLLRLGLMGDWVPKKVGSARSRLRKVAPWVLVLLMAGGLAIFTILGPIESEADYFFMLAGVVFGVVGALVLARSSGNRIGRVMVVSGFFILGSGVLSRLGEHPSVGEQVSLISQALSGSMFMSLFFLFGLLLYWFPTGRPASPRWRWALWLGIGGCLLAASYLFSEELCVEGGSEVCRAWTRNPIGIPGVPNPEYGRFSDLTFGLLAGFALLSAISLIARFIRSKGIERLQVKWLTFAVGSVLSLILLWDILDNWIYLPWSGVFFGISILSLPVAVGISVLRYRLYDIDRIISRTVAYTLVVATLTVAYLAVVLGVGSIAARVGPTDLGIPIPVLATALVAIGFQPVRQRALRVANRLVFGKRRTPYEALAGIEEVELEELLPQIARLVTESTAADRAIIWLSDGNDLEPAALFPDDGTRPEPIPLVDGHLPESADPDTTCPLLHQGRLIGAITTGMKPGEDLPADDKRLLKDLAGHAARAINGVLEATPLPDGIVTFLMTDIEGSTRLWEDDSQRMTVALRHHDELARRVIGQGGGILVKWRGEGDSTFSVFTDPAEGVASAIRLQDAIKDFEWSLDRPISIRAAIHTGEAELRDRDYFGQTVNRCARLRSLAEGGQTLISAATRELVRSGLLETLTFKDLGEHQLRDLSEPERVYEVISQTRTGSTTTSETVRT